MVVVLLKNVFSVVIATSPVVSTGKIIDFVFDYCSLSIFVPFGRQIICSWTIIIINVLLFLW